MKNPNTRRRRRRRRRRIQRRIIRTATEIFYVQSLIFVFIVDILLAANSNRQLFCYEEGLIKQILYTVLWYVGSAVAMKPVTALECVQVQRTVSFSETSLDFHRSTLRNIPEESTPR
jgi:hypothetical protein